VFVADIERLLFLADGRLVVRTDDGEVRVASDEENAGSRMIWPFHRGMWRRGGR
jgi:hypothetical protein